MSIRLILSLALVTATATAAAQPQAPTMQRYLIEREMPGASKMTPEQLRGGAEKSNAVLRALGPDIQWVQSHVTDDKIYCIYRAPNEEIVREHAKRGGFPADNISQVRSVIDPMTAE